MITGVQIYGAEPMTEIRDFKIDVPSEQNQWGRKQNQWGRRRLFNQLKELSS